MERTVKPDRSVSGTVLCAVAEFEDRCPTALPPFHETLDADALDELFSLETDTTPQFDGGLLFEYSDSSVTIWSDRSVTVPVT